MQESIHALKMISDEMDKQLSELLREEAMLQSTLDNYVLYGGDALEHIAKQYDVLLNQIEEKENYIKRVKEGCGDVI